MSKKKELTEEEFLTKRTPKAPYRNNSFQGIPTEEGVNTKFIENGMVYFNLPRIDMTDVNAVQERINFYLKTQSEFDMKPTVTGLASALKITRFDLYGIVSGNWRNTRGEITRLPEDVTHVIKEVYQFLGQYWEDCMMSGKVNPVTGIFLGKNHFAYKDQQEYTIAAGTDSPDADNVRKKYLQAQATFDSVDSGN